MRRLVPILLVVAAAANAQNLALKPVIRGLDHPLGVVHAGDARLFIVQQTGTIAVWDGTRVLPTPFLDVHALISCCSERGLLGLAFDPHYQQNGLFYIDYTNTPGDITIARYRVSSDPNRADPLSATIVLTIPHRTFANHNGGELQFGPDGYLYIGTGDGGGAGDPLGNGQNRDALLAKILRIDVSALPYAIPATNPFHTEVWAWGLRNPWRFSFDRATGDLWIGDVGQDKYEEVDLQPAGSAGGQNYGWHLMEGLHCYVPATNCANASLILPILEYTHVNNACSITGGYRYRGTYVRMRGIYFFGDYCSGMISGATQQSDGSWSVTHQLATTLKITSFGEDMNGELYVVDQNGAVDQLIDSMPARRRSVAK